MPTRIGSFQLINALRSLHLISITFLVQENPSTSDSPVTGASLSRLLASLAQIKQARAARTEQERGLVQEEVGNQIGLVVQKSHDWEKGREIVPDVSSHKKRRIL